MRRPAAAFTVLALTLSPLAAVPSAAAASAPRGAVSPQEAVIPAWTLPGVQTDTPSLGGTTGFLHTQQALGLLWTSYDGATRRVAAPPEQASGTWTGGPDVVASPRNPGRTTAVLQDMATGAVAVVPVPTGTTYRTTAGSTVVASGTAADGTQTLHLLTPRTDGTVGREQVGGLPARIRTFNSFLWTGPRGFAVTMTDTSGASHRSYVTLADHTARPLLEQHTVDDAPFVRGSDHLGVWTADGRFLLYRYDDLDTPERSYPLPRQAAVRPVGLVGDWLLAARWEASADDPGTGPGTDTPAFRTVAIHLTDGEERPLLATATAQGVPLPDGGALLVGGSGADAAASPDWGVQRVEPDASGVPVLHRVYTPTPNRTLVRGLSTAQGWLTALTLPPSGRAASLTSRQIGAAGDITVAAPFTTAAGARYADCWLGADCPHFLETGQRAEQPDDTLGGAGQGPSEVVDADGRHVLHRVRQAGGGALVEVVDTDSRHVVRTGTGPVGALHGTALLQPGAAPGTVSVTDIATGRAAAPIALGASCTPTELQATGRWVYWACGAEQAGVLDTAAHRTTPVPAGGRTVLGDGFTVRADAGGLLTLTDVRGDAPVSRPVGTARDADPGDGWAVDRNGGRIAYVDAQDAVHVQASGVPASPLAVADRREGAAAIDLRSGESWHSTWWLTRPTSGWRLEVRDPRTGRVVRTASGRPAAGRVEIYWSGRGSTDARVADGTYAWSVAFTPADGTGPVATASGTVRVSGGAPAAHDYGSSALGDVLVSNSAGDVGYRPATGTGGVGAARRIAATHMPLLSAVVPIGDLDGDRCNDVLLRFRGTLEIAYGTCGGTVRPSLAVLDEEGWGRYDRLLSPGDLTGDGRPDLLARDRYGVLWMYPANSTGRLDPRRRAGSGLSGYTLLVGAGDLNGDGVGDLLGRDRAGVLWRWFGNGAGGWSARVRLGSGFNAYNALAGVGDLTGDGKADLVGRDTRGNVVRWNGRGNGSYAGGTRIATGWQGYSGLY
ncbi:FG-GAP-like repeat-containing protein [Streptomyces sp. NPDC001380]|uniref:FG-GAP-like repeat-containing protein n=1 Tax=Streptomyces sp. NPDC001380 TaxID=3364566 RepID=UPI00367AF066